MPQQQQSSVTTPRGAMERRAAVVIEDDVEIRNLVSAVLELGGFQVHTAATGREGVTAVREEHPVVVTLDIGLPDIDGYEVLRRLRSTTDCYVVVLSGRADEMDILTALQLGADDYVLKPFRPRELRARIDALLRRPRSGHDRQRAGAPSERASPNSSPAHSAQTHGVPANAVPPTGVLPNGAPADTAPGGTSHDGVHLLRHGTLVLDSHTRTATSAGQEIPLTKTEFNLLHELLRSNGAVRTKEELVRVSRGRDYRGYNFVSRTDERAIEVHIANLRQKLIQNNCEPDLITTVRGVGFRIVPKRPNEH